jgi:hypothetical protein
MPVRSVGACRTLIVGVIRRPRPVSVAEWDWTQGDRD